jgi:hypothetical protein
VRRLRTERWRQENGCCITTTHRLTLPFSAGNFLTKECLPPPILLSSVSPIEDGTEGPPLFTN